MSKQIEQIRREDQKSFDAVVDWRKDFGTPEYGYDGKGREANFTGWIRNPDIGRACNIHTKKVASYNPDLV